MPEFFPHIVYNKLSDLQKEAEQNQKEIQGQIQLMEAWWEMLEQHQHGNEYFLALQERALRRGLHVLKRRLKEHGYEVDWDLNLNASISFDDRIKDLEMKVMTGLDTLHELEKRYKVEVDKYKKFDQDNPPKRRLLRRSN